MADDLAHFTTSPATSPANRTGCSAAETVSAAEPPLAAETTLIADGPEFMVRHDALAMALLAFERAPAGFRGTERFELTLAARALGWSGQSGERLLDWSRARVVAYRAVMAAAVREMLGAISINNSLTRRIGE